MLVASWFTEQSLTDRVSPRSRRNRHSVYVPRGLFPDVGEVTSIVIVATNDAAWRVTRGFEELMLRDPHPLARGCWQSIGRPFLGGVSAAIYGISRRGPPHRREAPGIR
jgi:hypothetical protein